MPSGEFDFIRWIRGQQLPSEMVLLPAGDDLAVLRWPDDDLLLVGTDQVLDGVHFDSSVHSPREIGAKAMNRNLSDCAAMACLPAAAVASVALPRGTGIEYARELYTGMRIAGERFGCALVGGDTGSWSGPLSVTVAILGRAAGIAPVKRSGARPGDSIFVTGPLGGAMRGRHLAFVPRVTEARRLAATGLVTAMIDISDGLARDLGHICRESGVGAIIDAGAVPIHADAVAASVDGRSAFDHAAGDGEDYELLFTASRGDFEGCFRIGKVIADGGLFVRSEGRLAPLEPRGWEHSL